MVLKPSSTMREAGTSKSARRRVGRRLSATHIMIAVVVILAFVLNLLVLRDRSSTTLVAVADRPLTVGSMLSPDTVRLVPVDSSFEGLESLIDEDRLKSFSGWVLTRPVAAGGLIDPSALLEPGDHRGVRTMSIPVSVEHAAGGTLIAGDRVDVITVRDGSPAFVAGDLEVTGVAEPAAGAIGTTTGYHIVVAVTADQALALAAALDAESLEIVRANGAAIVGARSETDDS